eukprot:7660946-Prorocentrum_lima.AAC.1
MPSASFPAWPTSNHSDQNTCKSCEYHDDPNTYSYYKDMHPDTDTESEWDEDMRDVIEYQTLVSSASNDPVAAHTHTHSHNNCRPVSYTHLTLPTICSV